MWAELLLQYKGNSHRKRQATEKKTTYRRSQRNLKALSRSSRFKNKIEAPKNQNILQMSLYNQFQEIANKRFGLIRNIVTDFQNDCFTACFTDENGHAWEMIYEPKTNQILIYPLKMKEVRKRKGFAELKEEEAKAEEMAVGNRKANYKEIAIARRVALKKLSDDLKALEELNGRGRTEVSVNTLLREFYAQQGHEDLKSFHEWKKNGYIVRKGETALSIWGRPIDTSKKKDNETDYKEDEEKTKDYYPIALLFSRKQVVKINQK